MGNNTLLEYEKLYRFLELTTYHVVLMVHSVPYK